VLERLEETRSKLESTKTKKSKEKKDINTLTKTHKTEIQKLQDEISSLKESLVHPNELEKAGKKQKELESQIKNLKEDLARKRDLVSSLKASNESTTKKAEEIMSKSETKREEVEKISKLSRELSRKDSMMTTLKAQFDELKEKESKSQQEIKKLETKLKSIRSDLSRKETMLKDMKEKLEEEAKDSKDESKTVELSKHKEMVRKYKQEVERKESKISMLETKLESTNSQMEKLKNESVIELKASKADGMKDSKKYDNMARKLRKYEEAASNGVLVLRIIIKEMILTVEKLRSDVRINLREKSSRMTDYIKQNETSSIHSPLKSHQLNSDLKPTAVDNTMSDIYKESLDILGVSLGELEEFVQPNQSPRMNDKLQIFGYNQDPSWVTSSKNTIGPGLNFEDLGLVERDNKDLEIFTKVLNAIVEDPDKLLTESEDIVQIFKKLLKEVKSLEASLSCHQTGENMTGWNPKTPKPLLTANLLKEL
jgi:DNA repair protein SbcC/Rad50